MTNRECFKVVFGVDGSIVANVLPKDDISLGSCGYYGCNEECCCSRIYPRCPKWWDDKYDKDIDQQICKIAGIDNIGDLSDGYHTFNELYYQRCVLFATIVNSHKQKAWKTRRHEDGELCFGGGWFLVTVETPAGAYGYHYEDKYWDMFDCEELDKAKPWDGYTDKDVGRLLSLE